MNYNSDNPKFHEEVFNAVGDIVHECYNYLSKEEADDLEVIYAIGNLEKNLFQFKPFYQIKNRLLFHTQLNNKDTYESQIKIQQLGTEFLVELEEIFDSFDQKSPTQIKIQYYSNEEKVEYQFEYNLLWSNTDDIFPNTLEKRYFNEINKNNN